MKFNFMKIKGNIFRHRQIEKRNGLWFMRLKQRPLVRIKRVQRNLSEGWMQ